MSSTQPAFCTACRHHLDRSSCCMTCGRPPLEQNFCNSCFRPLPPPSPKPVVTAWDINPKAHLGMKKAKNGDKHPNEAEWCIHRPERDWTDEEKVKMFDLILAHSACINDNSQTVYRDKLHPNYTQKKPLRLIHNKLVDKLMKGLVNLAADEEDRHMIVINFDIDMISNLKTPMQDAEVALRDAFSHIRTHRMHKERIALDIIFEEFFPKMSSTLCGFANAARARRDWSNTIMVANAFATYNLPVELAEPTPPPASSGAANRQITAPRAGVQAPQIRTQALSPARTKSSQGTQSDSPKKRGGSSTSSVMSLSSGYADAALGKAMRKLEFTEMSPSPKPAGAHPVRLLDPSGQAVPATPPPSYPTWSPYPGNQPGQLSTQEPYLIYVPAQSALQTHSQFPTQFAVQSPQLQPYSPPSQGNPHYGYQAAQPAYSPSERFASPSRSRASNSISSNSQVYYSDDSAERFQGDDEPQARPKRDKGKRKLWE
ncbi:hypothetical protein DFH11DRAFT_1549293 [Phellopilus nigrolimitatus]|nr:hypothetical protein DFH11DRAFT_1549293 [Phellopilus nigrolimitatus]